MDKQRIYDAMLIKAFRKDVTTGMLNYWLKPYGIHAPDKSLLRQPPAHNFRVQSFVGKYLKPLADRLWDTDKTHDLRTLDWMATLTCKITGSVHKDLKELRVQSNIDRQRGKVLGEALEASKRSNQWGVCK